MSGPLSALPYVPYGDDLEKPFPNEAAISAEILASMQRMIQSQFDVHRHGLRDAHAKSHGALKGTLNVYDDIPDFLKQGVFAKARSYPVVIRVSTSPSTLQSDAVNCLRAFAIKLIGVDGPQLLPERKEEKTQDFLLINSKILPFTDVSAYLKGQKINEKRLNGPEFAKILKAQIAGGINGVLSAIGKEIPLLAALASPHTHILGESFHSAGVLRFGDYFGKISLVPLSPNVKAFAGELIDPNGRPSILRDLVVDFFNEHEAEYELRVQLCTDLSAMPVEDPSVEWPESLSPHHAIGKITLPVQAAYSAARRNYVDDVLSFNPWHGIEAHRPLGNLMRVRRLAYEASSRLRHELNGVARYEPRDISDIPD